MLRVRVARLYRDMFGNLDAAQCDLEEHLLVEADLRLGKSLALSLVGHLMYRCYSRDL